MSNLIFFGSDRYSAVALDSIILSGDSRKITVVTDQKVGGSEVEKLAIEHNLLVSYYPDFDHSLIKKDTLGLCASFDHLIPKEIIELFNGNLYNLHPSLLPQYRNVSPVQYAIAMGDKKTGITLFRISTGIDNGKIIAQVSEPILRADTTLTITPRLFKHGADVFLRFLGSDLKGSAQPADSKAGRSDPIGTPLIFTHRLTRDSGFIEWPVLSKLLADKPITNDETKNELLSLRTLLKRNSRLQAEKGSSADERRVLEGTQILSDLIRALTPWPGIWSNVPTKKGELRISLVPKGSDLKGSAQPADSTAGRSDPTGFTILISGKPNPISISDFTKYYL